MSKSELWNNSLNKLKEEHDKILDMIPHGSKVALLDIPMYDNVGDILIYLGTLEFVKKNNINLHYKAGKGKRFIKWNKIKECDVILLQGGGNFGDLYPDFQKYRELIVEKFHEKIIIQLPQSIHFSSNKKLEQSAEVFKRHPNFHMIVRDNESYEVSKSFSNNIYLLPDMAHNLHPLKELEELKDDLGEGSLKILNHTRVDEEISNENNSFVLTKRTFDWDDLLTLQDFKLLEVTRKISKLGVFEKKAVESYDKIAKDLVFKAINYFELYDLISTDRLHGCILSVLLGKHIYLRDNSYAKIARYKKAWLNDYPYIIDAKTLSKDRADA